MTGLKARLLAFAGWRRALAAVLLGVAATAALPPLYILPLFAVGAVGLVWLIDGSRNWRGAFAAGWWFGLGHFSSGLYWFANALLTEPERFAWLIAPGILGVSSLLAVFIGLAAAVARLCPPGVLRALGLALAWVAAEWLRGRVLTGFPWNLAGSVWGVSDAMIQLAALAGIYGLSFVTVLAAALPATLAGRPAGWRGWLPSVLACVLLATVWTGGAVRLSGAGTDTVAGVRLRLVQPNVAQHHKWKPELREALFARHIEMTASPGISDVTHVIWAETAIPYFIENDAARRRIIAAVVPPGGLLLAGAVRTTPQRTDPPQIWNSLQVIDPRGDIVATYDKAHLVPFGEYVPFREYLPLGKITYGEIGFSAGPGPRTLRLEGLPAVGPLICYEAIFPHEVVDPDDRPRWLLNVTNDAWYGLSSGPYQHFESARMRAVEQGLPLVRVANTGISGVVDPYGRVTARLGLGRRGVLDVALPEPLGEPPPYARWGDLTLLVWGGGICLFLTWRTRETRKVETNTI